MWCHHEIKATHYPPLYQSAHLSSKSLLITSEYNGILLQMITPIPRLNTVSTVAQLRMADAITASCGQFHCIRSTSMTSGSSGGGSNPKMPMTFSGHQTSSLRLWVPFERPLNSTDRIEADRYATLLASAAPSLDRLLHLWAMARIWGYQ